MFSKVTLSIISILLSYVCVSADPVDFDRMVQPFVLAEKKIEIPGYPLAYNPSVARWQGKVLMSFRYSDPANFFLSYIGLVWLDDALNPDGAPQLLDTRVDNPELPCRSEDARLITIGEKLYVVYNDNYEGNELAQRRMFVSQITYEEGVFKAAIPIYLRDYELKSSQNDAGTLQKHEKNWTPFDYAGAMMLAYSLDPHRILFPSMKTGRCKGIANTSASIDWAWGQLRGGTPALLLDQGMYLAFFHSCAFVVSTQSNGRPIDYYVMGAYTFQSEPPFTITGISQEPIVGKTFYSPEQHPKAIFANRRVIYPSGFIFEGNEILVFYGREDCEVWVAKIDKKALVKSLKMLSSPR